MTDCASALCVARTGNHKRREPSGNVRYRTVIQASR